ncbi:MAG: DUF1254 domain-containing protein [Christensenellales bacterium]
MKKSFILLLAVIMAFSSPMLSASGSQSGSQKDVWKAVKEAYIYAFPLVLMDATKMVSINTEEPDFAKGKAPINQLMHGKKLADADFKTIVSPNVDTVYSSAWYNLSDEPMVYVFPETDRFCNVQIFDAWTNTVCVFDKVGDYAVTLSTWEGELPQGVTRINVPTTTAWSITRTVLSGEEDLPNVRAIQGKMKLLPLSAYVNGGEYSPEKGSYAKENDYVPIEKVLSLGPKAFFDKANELMKTNPPAAADAKVVERFASINVGAGLNFDLSILSGDVVPQWKEMLQSLKAEIINETMKFSVKLGQWSYFGPPIGDYGTEYLFPQSTKSEAEMSAFLAEGEVDLASKAKTALDINPEWALRLADDALVLDPDNDVAFETKKAAMLTLAENTINSQARNMLLSDYLLMTDQAHRVYGLGDPKLIFSRIDNYFVELMPMDTLHRIMAVSLNASKSIEKDILVSVKLSNNDPNASDNYTINVRKGILEVDPPNAGKGEIEIVTDSMSWKQLALFKLNPEDAVANGKVVISEGTPESFYSFMDLFN